jgi:acyl carrier protein
MTQEEKLKLLTETIEAEPGELSPETDLRSLEIWDSLAKLSVLAMFISNFEREIEVEKVRGFKTVGDILDEMHE